MNRIFGYLKDPPQEGINKVLLFRQKSLIFWIGKLLEYTPKILNKDKFLKDVKCELVEPKNHVYYGFSKENILLLKITAKINDEEKSKYIYLPVPNRNDMFIVNNNKYILINQLTDTPIAVYKDNRKHNAIIRIKNNVIDPFGKAHIGNIKLNTLLFFIATEAINKDAVTIKRLAKKEAKEYGKQYKIDINYDLAGLDPNSIFYKNIIQPAIDIFTHKDYRMYENLDNLKDKINFYDLGTYFKILLDEDLDSTLSDIIKNKFQIIQKLYNNNHKKYFYSTDTKRVMYYDIIVKFLFDKFDAYIENNKNKRTAPKDIHIAQESALKWLVSSNPVFEYISDSEYNMFVELNLKESIYYPMKYYKDMYRNLDLSFKYKIDPINTPDGDKIGQKQRLSRYAEINEMGYFLD